MYMFVDTQYWHKARGHCANQSTPVSRNGVGQVVDDQFPLPGKEQDVKYAWQFNAERSCTCRHCVTAEPSAHSKAASTYEFDEVNKSPEVLRYGCALTGRGFLSTSSLARVAVNQPLSNH